MHQTIGQLRPAVVLLAGFTVLTGLLYPLLVTAIAQTAFRHRANGSLMERDGKLVGSELIGQAFSSPRYFWGRLSATTPGPYNGAASGGSNLGPMNTALRDAAQRRIQALRDADPGSSASVPVDLVTASGSGLDPHISPAAAGYQLRRVARARGIAESAVREAILRCTEGPQLGLLGEPRVNVLRLNLALDAVE